MNTKAKELVFEEDARVFLRDGIEHLAEVVAMTLGPRGRNVGIEASWGSPMISSDGYTVSKDLELKNPFLNMGLSMGKEVAAKIKEKSGDGTTTGIVLLRALVQSGIKNIAAGANPTAIKRGMDKALEKIMEEIDRISVSIQNSVETRNIATVSASGNTEIGEMISQCFEKVGKTGVVAIEEGKGTETIIELVEGMQFDKGYLSAYFCTNNEKLIVEMNHPAILITDKKIGSAQEILPILQQVAAAGQELLIIADDLEGDALSTLVINKLRGSLKIAAVKAPGFGDQRKAMLEDLAILTGGQLVSEEKGYILRDSGSEVLGHATQITISKDKTTIVGGQGSSEAIKARIGQLEAAIANANSKYDKEKLEERKAKLQGGVALIQVGAPTESEMKKKKQTYEDSLNSTRAALEEGIIPGGGIALLQAGRSSYPALSPEEQIGANILYKACEAPFRQIVINTGLDASVILDQVLAHQNKSYGFNALTETIEDLLLAGIIDPVKVVKSSLRHAVSMAGVVLLSEALIANAEEKEGQA
jgi:chaperonin GroEL